MTDYFVHCDYVTYYLMTGQQATQLGSAKSFAMWFIICLRIYACFQQCNHVAYYKLDPLRILTFKKVTCRGDMVNCNQK